MGMTLVNTITTTLVPFRSMFSLYPAEHPNIISTPSLKHATQYCITPLSVASTAEWGDDREKSRVDCN